MEKMFGAFPGFFSGFPHDMLVKMWPAMKAYASGYTTIPPKYRELASFAVASALGCASCETFHQASAKVHGASDEELAEMRTVVKHVAFWHSLMKGADHDAARFMKEFQAMAEYLAKQEKGTKSG